ncbi:MAG: indole-3-glycerol phosphate synthase TrpC [Dehalococcoidia bacterium]
MSTILEEILKAKRQEVARHKAETPLEELERRIAEQPPPLNLSGALWGERVRLVAEVKKASPSRGLLCPDFDPVALARTYAEHGAAAISVLTDRHFEGTLEHLGMVREAVAPYRVPVLRKDFILDPYQVYEARAWGADAILFIVAALETPVLRELLELSGRFWMQCLVEVHNEGELQTALEAGAEVIGINNRDLHTFHTDRSVTERLVPLIPRGRVIVTESGITSAQEVQWARRLGVHAVLVGEALVTAPDVAAKVRELAGSPARERQP